MTRPPGIACRGAGFCQELSGDPDTEFRAVYAGDPPTRIIDRGRNFILMADMSPLCAGHLLIAPYRHYLSFAEAVRDHEHEVRHMVRRVFELYAPAFGEPVILEHGSTSAIDGSSCITHAHWHLLPLRLDDVHAVMAADGLGWSEIGGLDELAQSGRDTAYFLCADRRRCRLYGPGRTRPRQYLRSVAGTILGIPDPEWDYAVVVRKDLLRMTMAATAGWRLEP
jgi:diadenosine tetraphosphate (Ap4A) HIT family hydrolase